MRRLVLLGDSFVQALEVPWKETFYARLERRAREAGGPPVETLPMAVTGYGQAQQLLWFERLGRRLEPDVVLLSVFLGNDVTDNSPEFHIGATRPYFALEDGGLRLVQTPNSSARWKYTAAKYLRSFILYKEIGHRVAALRRVAARLGFVNYAWDKEQADRAELSRKRRSAYELTFALVDRIAQAARQAGAEPLVMVHGEYPTGSQETPDDLFARFCRARGLRCVRLGLEPDENPTLFVTEDRHWSSRGHRRVAEIIWARWGSVLLGNAAEAGRSSGNVVSTASETAGAPARSGP